MNRFVQAILEPRLLVRAVRRRSPFASFTEKLAWDAVDRPNYAYCLHQAALQARALEIQAITAIELGVAGGNGLVTLERLAAEVTSTTGVAIDVIGFDAGGGMPPPDDYRDLPYVWQAGLFEMNADLLRARLSSARLVLGDVTETIPAFIMERDFQPIGFVSFDLDYYSSTVAAFPLLDTPAALRLPRVFCYFDDILGDDWELHCSHVGELAAISTYNETHPHQKLAPIHGLAHKRKIPAAWNDQIYVSHDFEHPLYNRHIHPATWDLSLIS